MMTDLQEVCRVWEAARQRHHAAQSRGDKLTAEAAAAAELEALEAIAECKHAIATTFTFMLRLALDWHPDAVREFLRDAITDILADELPDAVKALTYQKWGQK
jgi:hypothetical protein